MNRYAIDDLASVDGSKLACSASDRRRPTPGGHTRHGHIGDGQMLRLRMAACRPAGLTETSGGRREKSQPRLVGGDVVQKLGCCIRRILKSHTVWDRVTYVFRLGHATTCASRLRPCGSSAMSAGRDAPQHYGPLGWNAPCEGPVVWPHGAPPLSAAPSTSGRTPSAGLRRPPSHDHRY